MWHVWGRRELLAKFRWRNLKVEVRDQIHGQAAFPFGIYDQAANGYHSRLFGEEINFLPLPGIETRFLGCPPRRPFSIWPAISRLKEWQRYLQSY
jgi:hypothetical protein